ncbi:MAG TPA: HAD family hydrolase [Jatrophihabitantaceae bacterium]|nr:HAD family hydrolase [Jatrophihabitantaceae bacterium]
MTIRLLASDLDGTLLRTDGSVSDRTRAALARAGEAGFPIVFVTGRPPRWLYEVADATGHTGLAVAANGAVLYDLHSETVVREHLLAPELLAALTSRLRGAFPGVVFGVEYGSTFGHEPGYRHHWEISPPADRQGRPIPGPLVASLDEVISRGGVKLLAKHLDLEPNEFLRAASALLAGQASVTHSSNFGLLEIAVEGVTKASGLAEVAASRGISADEVAAVGDMPNDLPMLAWAGASYAVSNAHPSVLAVADHVVGSNDEDAVASLIESLLDPASL